MTDRYFIRDCKDNIVGNPKGYPTFRGADIQANSVGSKAYEAIWTAYDEAKIVRPDWSNLFSIRLNEEA